MQNLKLQFKSQKFSQFLILTCTFAFLLFTFNFSVSAQEATQSTDSVRDKVRKTIEGLTKKPRAVIGTLDSIADSTLKIKTEDGKLVLVATADNTTYSKTTDGKRADVKFADLAIGDFVAALGYKNGNDVVSSIRVLAFDKAPYPKKQAVYGEVADNSKGVLTIKTPNKEVWTIEVSKNTEIKTDDEEKVAVANIEEGDKVVAAGELSTKKNKTIVATKLQVISEKSEPKKASPKPSPSTSPRIDATPKPTSSPKASLKPSPSPSP